MAAAVVSAQTPAPDADGLVPAPSWAYNDLVCAPSLLMQKPAADTPAPRVVGVQDITHRDMLAPPDVLVIGAGSNAGIQVGQRYFVRRIRTTRIDPSRPPTVHTAGWIQILGVDTMVSTATIMHSCEGILVDDYLEPFVEPMVPARTLSGNVPQYENMGHIVTGIEGLQTAGPGNYMTIDRGTNEGVVMGQRYLIFRDKRDLRVETTGRSKAFANTVGQSPLVEIGEAVVVAVRQADSTVRVTIAKTAITTGDLIAPIR
jgi:hypothetical protein